MTHRPVFYELVITGSLAKPLPAPPHPPLSAIFGTGLVVGSRVVVVFCTTAGTNDVKSVNSWRQYFVVWESATCACECTSSSCPWELRGRGNGYITLESLCYLFVALYLFGAIRWSMNFILIMYKMSHGRYTASPLSCKDQFVYSRQMIFAYPEKQCILTRQNLWLDLQSTLVTYPISLKECLLCRFQTVGWYVWYTGCHRRKGPNFGRVFLMVNYTDITQNTYIQSWTVTEIMAREKSGHLAFPRNVRLQL